MALSINTVSTFDPVSVREVKERLRITSEQEDDVVLAIIRSATKWCEHELNWRLCTQTWTLRMDYWPADIIRMPYPPLQSVTSVKYYNSDNNLTALVEDTDYRVDLNSTPGRIDPLNGWPSLYDRLNPIEIEFICGYSEVDLIPEDIKDAIHLRTADLYEHRQDSYAGGVNNIVSNIETSHNILMRYKLYNEPCI